ncbi:GNAT family N-acetyltransferase [Paenibacillus agricola]|nr:GNAT family N-acetyltransferase [Paenibacillus agricola]
MEIQHYERVAKLWSKAMGTAVSLEFDSWERIAAYLKRNPNMSTVAMVNDEVVGTVLCGHDGRRGTLYHVAVSEEHRCKGVARQMVERSLSCLKQEGIDTAVLFAHIENVNAVEHWRRSGWPSYPNVLYHLREF